MPTYLRILTQPSPLLGSPWIPLIARPHFPGDVAYRYPCRFIYTFTSPSIPIQTAYAGNAICPEHFCVNVSWQPEFIGALPYLGTHVLLPLLFAATSAPYTMEPMLVGITSCGVPPRVRFLFFCGERLFPRKRGENVPSGDVPGNCYRWCMCY